MKLVFLGPPGAGKGTQAARMAEEFGLEHASTGEIFRRAVSEGTEVGRTVQSYLDAGELVPDELTSRVVEQMVVRRREDFILDGFPRTVPQAEMLEEMLGRQEESLEAVLHFEVDEETAVERLTGRLVCKSCGANYHRRFMPPREDMICDECGGRLAARADSSEEVVRNRLKEYREKTHPLVAYYRERDLLQRIDAEQAPDRVTEDTRRILERLRG